MALTVRILVLEEDGQRELGRLVLREGRIVAEPEDPVLLGILEWKFLAFGLGRVSLVMAGPEAFLRALHRAQGTYLRATEAEDLP